jgi:hypothetical protein
MCSVYSTQKKGPARGKLALSSKLYTRGVSSLNTKTT